jgi:hypothetical protein
MRFSLCKKRGLSPPILRFESRNRKEMRKGKRKTPLCLEKAKGLKKKSF